MLMRCFAFCALVALTVGSVQASNTIEIPVVNVDSTAWYETSATMSITPVVANTYQSKMYVSFGYDYTKLGDDMNMHGFSAGYGVEASISKTSPLFLDWGLFINWNWHSDDGTYSGYKCEQSDNLGLFRMPFSLMYKFSCGKSSYIAPYAGFNFKLALSGNTNIELSGGGKSADTDLNWFDDDGYDFGRFMMGWQVGVRYCGANGFIGLQVGTDFVRMDSDISQFNLGVNMGFYF